MKNLTIPMLLVLLLITSCSMFEEARRKEEIENNTKKFLDHFMTEIWNRPVNQLIDKPKVLNKYTYQHKKVPYKLETYGTVQKSYSYTAECNPDPTPPLTYRILKYKDKRIPGATIYDIELGVDVRRNYKTYEKNKITQKHEYVYKKCLRGPYHKPNDLDIVPLEKFKHDFLVPIKVSKNLLTDMQQRGFPKFDSTKICYKDFTSFDYHRKIRCNIDAIDYAQYPFAGVNIEVQYDGYLKRFNFLGLVIKDSESDKTLSEIYSSRLKEESYIKYLSEYNAEAKKINDLINKEKSRKANIESNRVKRQEAETNAWRRERARKRRRLLGDDKPTPVFKNPYLNRRVPRTFKSTPGYSKRSTRKSNNSRPRNNVKVRPQKKLCPVYNFGAYDPNAKSPKTKAEQERLFEKTIAHMSAECKNMYRERRKRTRDPNRPRNAIGK